MTLPFHMAALSSLWYVLEKIDEVLTPLFYFQIALFVSSSDAQKPGWLLNFLRGISPAQIKQLQQNLSQVCHHGYLLAKSLVRVLIFDSFVLYLARERWSPFKINLHHHCSVYFLSNRLQNCLCILFFYL